MFRQQGCETYSILLIQEHPYILDSVHHLFYIIKALHSSSHLCFHLQVQTYLVDTFEKAILSPKRKIVRTTSSSKGEILFHALFANLISKTESHALNTCQ